MVHRSSSLVISVLPALGTMYRLQLNSCLIHTHLTHALPCGCSTHPCIHSLDPLHKLHINTQSGDMHARICSHCMCTYNRHKFASLAVPLTSSCAYIECIVIILMPCSSIAGYGRHVTCTDNPSSCCSLLLIMPFWHLYPVSCIFHSLSSTHGYPHSL